MDTPFRSTHMHDSFSSPPGPAAGWPRSGMRYGPGSERHESPGVAAPTSPGPRRSVRTVLALVAVAVLAGSTGALATRALDDPGPVAAPRSELAGGTLDVAAVVARAGRAVVAVESRYGGGRRSATSAGTGIILIADGEVLTNAHVVEGASSVRVTLAGESQARDARVIGLDSSADVALLRIQRASRLPTADLGSSSTVGWATTWSPSATPSRSKEDPRSHAASSRRSTAPSRARAGR